MMAHKPIHKSVAKIEYARERFGDKVVPEPNSGCHLWGASLIPSGYGQFWAGGTQMGAHRAAWMYEHGDIPGNLSVLHKCNTRSCVNPKHLYLGNHKHNMADRKRRNLPGHNTSLTNEQVALVREALTTVERSFAEEFGVNRNTIRKIIDGEAYKYVTIGLET